MVPPLDIFHVTAAGELVWKGAADDLPAAHRQIQVLVLSGPGDYVIYSQKTGNKTVVPAKKEA